MHKNYPAAHVGELAELDKCGFRDVESPGSSLGSSNVADVDQNELMYFELTLWVRVSALEVS